MALGRVAWMAAVTAPRMQRINGSILLIACHGATCAIVCAACNQDTFKGQPPTHKRCFKTSEQIIDMRCLTFIGASLSKTGVAPSQRQQSRASLYPPLPLCGGIRPLHQKTSNNTALPHCQPTSGVLLISCDGHVNTCPATLASVQTLLGAPSLSPLRSRRSLLRPLARRSLQPHTQAEHDKQFDSLGSPDPWGFRIAGM